MKVWIRYRKSLTKAWEGLTAVSEEFLFIHDNAKTIGDELLRDGSGQLGSHLQELAERIDELNRFTAALRDLVDRAERRGASDFSRDAVKRQLKQIHQRERTSRPV